MCGAIFFATYPLVNFQSIPITLRSIPAATSASGSAKYPQATATLSAASVSFALPAAE